MQGTAIMVGTSEEAEGRGSRSEGAEERVHEGGGERGSRRGGERKREQERGSREGASLSSDQRLSRIE